MKKTILLSVLLFTSIFIYAQYPVIHIGVVDSIRQVKLDSICQIRGHVITSYCTSMEANCPPYYLDYPDSTVMVIPNCNKTECICQRCGRSILLPAKEKRYTIWRKEE
jgi:hypothetical protein